MLGQPATQDPKPKRTGEWVWPVSDGPRGGDQGSKSAPGEKNENRFWWWREQKKGPAGEGIRFQFTFLLLSGKSKQGEKEDFGEEKKYRIIIGAIGKRRRRNSTDKKTKRLCTRVRFHWVNTTAAAPTRHSCREKEAFFAPSIFKP